MKDTEEKLKEFFAEHQNKTITSSEQDERILEKVLAVRNQTQQDNPSRSNLNWSQSMKRKISWISAIAAVLLIGTGILFFNKADSGSYAIAQTIQAIQSIENVYFKAILFKQGPIECQMKFSPDKSKPTHIRLFDKDQSFNKIDSKYGSFTYNVRTGRYRQNTRNERDFDWYPDFRNIFAQALVAAESSENVQIYSEIDPDTLEESIIIDVSGPLRDVRYWIDPESKLPLRFSTTEIRNEARLMRQTIAVREMHDIQYNLDLPEEAFQIPADAEEVFEEVDVFVRPDVGMPVGDMDESEACIRIMHQAIDALNALDIDTFAKLTFPHGFLPREMLEQMLQAGLQKNPDGPQIELLGYEEPYEDGAFWYVKHTTNQPGKGIVEEVMPIRFYEFDGIRYCIIAYPD